MRYTIGDIRKALVAFVAPAFPLAYQALLDTSDGGSAITVKEWLLIVGAALGVSVAVFGVPNAGTYIPKAVTPAQRRATLEYLRREIQAMPQDGQHG